VRTDTRIALAVIAVYAVLSIILLPSGEYLRALGGGLAIFGIIAGLADSWGRGPIPGPSVLAVAFGAGAVLVMPTFPALGGTTPAAVPLGFLGMQAAVLWWAALRWQTPAGARRRVSLRRAWGFALAAAAALCAIAAIPATLSVVAGEVPARRMLLIVPAYFGGLLGAATAYWLLQRVAHLATGRYLIGVLGGACVYGAVAPVVQLFDKRPMSPREMLAIALVCGGLVGPAVTLSSTDDVAAA
jgi:hypothetical protein